MNFFKKDMLKIRSNTEENDVFFYINYFKLKELADFKQLLLKDMMCCNNCLAIINTEMKYNKNSIDNKKTADELISIFDKVGIKYIKIEAKKAQDIVVLGAVIRGNNKKNYKDYIIGFIVEIENLETIKSIINNYNINYYINNTICTDDELLSKFRSLYNDDEQLKAINTFDIFDDNFTKTLVIHSKSEDSPFVIDILEKLKKHINL